LFLSWESSRQSIDRQDKFICQLKSSKFLVISHLYIPQLKPKMTNTQTRSKDSNPSSSLRSPASRLSCAIYTRKSTEEGLDQDFNTLDAQRESAESYIKSQEAEGWVCLPDHYDDGGFTGGNMDRPALKRLLADIEAGKVDCIVVYKVDRLSRSLMDFTKMLEVFERKSDAFVSVTPNEARRAI
jgi:site-specific DNA recombinase